jgi:RNA polymerase sigma-70 factor, ECF subfamily
LRASLFEKRTDERFRRDVLCHVRAAYNLARWLVGNDHDAEDAVQEATVKALRGFGGYRGGDAKAWYLAIVRNTCMNLLRARSRRAEFETDADEAMDYVAAKAPGPDEMIEKAYDAEQLRRAIEALPATWREMIILREFEQLSYRELAEVASVPIGTVMSRLARARDRLHELLSQGAGA